MWKGLNSKSCSQEGKEGSLCPLLALTLQAALFQPNHVGMGRKHRCQPHGFILSSFSGHPEAPHLNCLTLGFTISDWGFMSIWFRKGNVIFLKLRVVNFMSLHVSSETHFSPSHSVCTHTHTHTHLPWVCLWSHWCTGWREGLQHHTIQAHTHPLPSAWVHATTSQPPHSRRSAGGRK